MPTTLIIVSVIILWSIWGLFSLRVEQADYSIVKQTEDYEIRQYGARIVAQTTVKGEYQQAIRDGFGIVASYIFGNNVKKESISMTAPVTDQISMSEKVAMTAPVLASVEGDVHVVSFGMPRNKTMDTLPQPNDERVKLVEVESKKFAVKRFSWWRTTSRVKTFGEKLLTDLKRDKIETVGSITYAGYNAPWTPPWMTRNEVMIEIK